MAADACVRVGKAVLVGLEVLVDGAGPVVRVKVDEGADAVEAVAIEGLPPNADHEVFLIELHALIALGGDSIGKVSI